MDGFSLGLPNQALKPFVSSYVQSVLETIPFEKHAEVASLVAGTETNVFPGGALTVVFTMPVNMKTFFEMIVNSSVADTIYRVYRNGVQVDQFQNNIAAESVLNPTGFEYDENETLQVTAKSATGGGNAIVDLRGRSSLKRNELFSQVIG